MLKKLFLPARLRRNTDVWYIEWHEISPSSSKMIRHRQTFSLNRIKDLKLRAKLAKKYVEEVNESLFVKYYEDDKPDSLSFAKAVQKMVDLKTRSDRDGTNKVYRTAGRHLLRVGKKEGWLKMDIRQFTKRHALVFSDDLLLNRKMANMGVNNVIRNVKTMFNTLIDREYIDRNPFRAWKKLPVAQKVERIYSLEERKIIMTRMKRDDPWLYRLCLLQYYGFIRPRSEMIRLKVEHFRFAEGFIFLPADDTKSRKKWRVVTIPDIILDELMIIADFPSNYYVFGQDLKPSINQGSDRTPYNRYVKILTGLRNEGMDTEGMKLYQWKHTGITENVKLLKASVVQAQAGHATESQTAHYVQPQKEVSVEMKEIRDTLGLF